MFSYKKLIYGLHKSKIKINISNFKNNNIKKLIKILKKFLYFLKILEIKLFKQIKIIDDKKYG